ncbi:Gfo/Idh/MocA family oxidoreductase, partial [Fulvivirga sp. RKSG066]|uniref:Gfo/Idh/MocA family protein n=1 Tax=Fulvivirga aurantia TaxID=2529383 RepID=UPI0012BB6BB5
MSKLRIGIVGTGMISNVVAKAILEAENAEIGAVASRKKETADEFAGKYNVTNSYGSWNEMIQSGTIDAVYLGVPTTAKEEIGVATAKAGLHLLADKPFNGYDSVRKMTDVCRENNVVFMDATHFVHNPRHLEVLSKMKESIGNLKGVNTSFFFPMEDKDNIRYNPEMEPTGVIGDMAWYNVRAMVEYLPGDKEIKKISTVAERDAETNAFSRAGGVIEFTDGTSSLWNAGFNSGVCVMDINILGERGLITMDDYVLDWDKGFAFEEGPSYDIGYTKREGMATPNEFERNSVPYPKSQAVQMIENFATLVSDIQN